MLRIQKSTCPQGAVNKYARNEYMNPLSFILCLLPTSYTSPYPPAVALIPFLTIFVPSAFLFPNPESFTSTSLSYLFGFVSLIYKKWVMFQCHCFSPYHFVFPLLSFCSSSVRFTSHLYSYNFQILTVLFPKQHKILCAVYKKTAVGLAINCITQH